MRIRLLGAVGLLTVALPFGTGTVCAQGWPGYAGQGPPPGYGSPAYAPYGAPPVGPVYPGYPGAWPVPPAYGPPAYGPPAAPVSVPAAPAATTPTPAVQAPPAPATPVTPAVPAPATPVLPAPAEVAPPDAATTPAEPVIKFVGQSRPGVLPPIFSNVPERPGMERWYFSASYLIANMRPEHMATPLVSTGSTNDVHPAGIGQPATIPLLDNVNFGTFSGVGLGFGLLLGDGGCWSLDWAGRFYFPEHQRFAAASDPAGNPIIARPVFDVVNGFERAFIDAFPGIAAGGVAVDLRSAFFTTEANLTRHFQATDRVRADALFGFRLMQLSENLRINDSLTSLQNNNLKFLGNFIGAGDVVSDFDAFRTGNTFYGLQFGGRLEWAGDYFFAGTTGKLGFGATEERVKIDGATALTNAAGTTVTPGGILALPSNIGNYRRAVFGFVPEIGCDVGVRLTPHLRLTAGYSLLYWSSVTRPGDVINRSVNPATVPSDNSFNTTAGAPAPIFHFSGSSYWVSTFNFGLDFQY